MNQQAETHKPEALTKAQLAALYKVHPRTFARWLTPFRDKIGDPLNSSRIYTPLQVTIIFEFLGAP